MAQAHHTQSVSCLARAGLIVQGRMLLTKLMLLYCVGIPLLRGLGITSVNTDMAVGVYS